MADTASQTQLSLIGTTSWMFRDHVEMCEKTHALRLQFEYEKNMWLAKHRQDCLDAAVDRSRLLTATASNRYWEKNESISQQEGSHTDQEIGAREIAERQEAQPPESEHGEVKKSNFMYDVPDEFDYVPIQSKVEELGEEEQDVITRKKKFSTPSRHPVGKAAIIVPDDSMTDDSGGYNVASSSVDLQNSLSCVQLMVEPYLEFSGIDEAEMSNDSSNQANQGDDTYNSLATDDTFCTEKFLTKTSSNEHQEQGLPISEEIEGSYIGTCIYDKNHRVDGVDNCPAPHGREEGVNMENRKESFKYKTVFESDQKDPNHLGIDLCNIFEKEDDRNMMKDDPDLEIFVAAVLQDNPVSIVSYSHVRDHYMFQNKGCHNVQSEKMIVHDDFYPAAPTTFNTEHERFTMDIPECSLGLDESAISNNVNAAMVIESGYLHSEYTTVNEPYPEQTQLRNNIHPQYKGDYLRYDRMHCVQDSYTMERAIDQNTFDNISKDVILHTDNISQSDDTYATRLDYNYTAVMDRSIYHELSDNHHIRNTDFELEYDPYVTVRGALNSSQPSADGVTIDDNDRSGNVDVSHMIINASNPVAILKSMTERGLSVATKLDLKNPLVCDKGEEYAKVNASDCRELELTDTATARPQKSDRDIFIQPTLISGTLEQSTDISDTLEKSTFIMDTFEQSNVISDALEHSTVISGTLEQSNVTSDTLEQSTSISDALEQSTDIMDTLEQSTVTSDTVEQSTDILDTLEQSNVTSDTLEQSTDISDALEQSTNIMDTLEQSTVISDTLEESTFISDALGQFTFISDTLEWPTVTSDALEQSTDIMDTLQQSTVISYTVEQSTVTSDTLQQSNVTSDALEQHTDISDTLEKSSDVLDILEESNVTSDALEQSTDVLDTLEQHTVTSDILEQSTVISDTLEQSTATYDTLEQSTDIMDTLEQSTDKINTIEQSTVTADILEKSTDISDALEQPTDLSDTLEQSTITSDTLKRQSTVTADTLEQSAVTLDAIEQPTDSSNTLRQPTDISDALEQPTFT